MSNPNLPMPERGANDQQTIENLMDVVMKLRKELQYALSHLDDSNMQPNSISAKSIATETLIVGNNIAMGDDAFIAWGNVSGIPNDLVYTAVLNNYPNNEALANALSFYTSDTDLANALAGYITDGTLSTALSNYLTEGNFNTLIGEDYIVTGKIAANQIAVGTLTGMTIQTDALGSRIVMNDTGINSYSDTSGINKHGACIVSDANGARYDVYENGLKVASLYYDGAGNVALSALAGTDLYLTGTNIKFNGNIDFGVIEVRWA